jgi:ADP-ribosylglycohydrolase
VAFGAIGADPRADAEVTNAEDGVLGAVAMAAAISMLVAGASMSAAIEAALAELPSDTAIGRASRIAVEVALKAGDPFAAIPALDAALLDHVYSYGVAAAETVPVALALAAVSGQALHASGQMPQARSSGRSSAASRTVSASAAVSAAVPTAVSSSMSIVMSAAVSAAACLPSLADSAPALTGALTGAFIGYAAQPEGWRAAARTLAGCSLPELAGRDLLDIAGGLA